MALCTAIKEFILENCTKVNQWYGSEDGSGAEAYFAGATTADKLNDFSSLEGSTITSSAPAQTGGAPATSQGGSGGDDIAAEFTAATASLMTELKNCATTIGNESVIKVTNNYGEVMQNQAALLKTMGSFKKPADIAFSMTKI
jgi:hypothetical protein